MNKNIIPIIQWYFGPHLPKEHFIITSQNKPKNSLKLIDFCFRRWLVHPLKRHIAHNFSSYLKKQGTKIIGITGSSGKTTTKEMVASVLRQKLKTIWTPDNIDPVFNIPTTILKTPKNTEALVLEMGVEYPGEMDYYLWLAKPSIGIITNISWTHTEFFGDIKVVFKEKSKLINNLPENGYAIFNYNDKMLRNLAKKTKAKVIFVGTNKNCDIYAKKITYTKELTTKFELVYKDDSITINMPFLGKHLVISALASAATGIICGLTLKQIKRGIEKTKPQPHRLIPHQTSDKAIVIDDTYNANPKATIKSLEVLSEIGKGKKKIFIFGEMKELGRHSKKGHQKVGEEIARQKIDYVLTLGYLTEFTLNEAIKRGVKKENTFLFPNKDEIIKKLKAIDKSNAVILIKGSRFWQMEEIVERILTHSGKNKL